MGFNNGYCLAQLKQAENLARDGYFDSSINAIGRGVERLLKDMFGELRDNDKSNLFTLTNSYLEAKKKRRWTKKKQGTKELTLYAWIKFYQNEDIFRKLEKTSGYQFDDFNIDNLHRIRIARNDFGAHEDEEYGTHREMSGPLIQLYSKILSETGRNPLQTSIVPFNQSQNADPQELMLRPEEKSLLMREYDDELRSSPDDTDILFLRAYLLRGENAVLDDLERILILEPNHSEARKERIRSLNRNYNAPTTQSYQRSSSTVTQVKIESHTTNVSHQHNLSENRFSSAQAERNAMNPIVIVAVVVGIVVLAAIVGFVVLGLETLNVLNLLVVELSKFINVSLRPHIPGILIVVGFLALVWIIRYTRKKSLLQRAVEGAKNFVNPINPFKRRRKSWWRIW